MELNFRESGPKTAEAILFLHGSPLSSRMWIPKLEHLTEYHCLAPDLPGHGGTADCFSSMDELVSALADFIMARTVQKKVHLVGLSFGGVVAQALMVAHPELLGKVILSGTSTRLSRFMVALQSLNLPLLRWLSAEQLARMIGRQFKIPAKYEANLLADMRQFNLEGFSAMIQAYTGIEMPDNFNHPVLAVVGGQETFVAKKAAWMIGRSLPDAKAVVVPGLGHVWNLQSPELFVEMIGYWLTETAVPNYLIEMI